MTNEQEFPEAGPTEQFRTTGSATSTLPPVPPRPVPPVQRRSNGWAVGFGVLAAAAGAMLLLTIGLFAIGIAVFVGVVAGDIDIETDRVDVSHAPVTFDDLPTVISEENGKIEIDLTNIDISEVDALTSPVDLDVQADFGAITVIVPEDIDVSVDASVDVGDVTVFGDSSDGFANTVVIRDADADVALELDLNVGQIEVVRG